MGRLGRFLRLEGPRREGSSPAHKQALDRFEDLQTEASTESGPAPTSTERFEGEPPAIALDPASPEVPPFRPCLQCRAENGRYAESCEQCGVPLDSPGQRRFEQEFAEAWQRKRAAEAQEAAERQEAQSVSDEQARRTLGIFLAQQVRARMELEWLQQGERVGWRRWRRQASGGDVLRRGNLFERWVSRIEPFWLRLLVRLILIALPIALLLTLWALPALALGDSAISPYVSILLLAASGLALLFNVARRRRP